MTQTFTTDENNDLYVGPNGNLAMTNDLLAVRDACQFAAKTQLAEMVLATDKGIPNFQSIWVGVPNIQQYQAALSTTLLAVDQVSEILNLVINVTNNTLNYTVSILTTYGQTVINGSV